MSGIDQPLIVKYRPTNLGEVLGHYEVVAALQRAMQGSSHPHTYLLHGIRGIGKTSIARLIGEYFDCFIVEFDAASHSGVEETRVLVDEGSYMSMQGSGNKMLLVDECHRLSRNAMDALLKLTEEPPAHLYIALCTTEPSRLSSTLVSRCYEVKLKPLKINEMFELANLVADLEGWRVNPDVMQELVSTAEGSPRVLLTRLQTAYDAPNRDAVRRIVSLEDAGDPEKELCQLLVKGNTSWKRVRELLAQIEEDDPDYSQALIGAARYISKVMVGQQSEPAAIRIWQLMDALTFPSNSFDPKVVFLTAVGRMLWGDTHHA